MVLAAQQRIAHVQGIEEIPNRGRIERKLPQVIGCLRRDIVGHAAFTIIDECRIVNSFVCIPIKGVLIDRIHNINMDLRRIERTYRVLINNKGWSIDRILDNILRKVLAAKRFLPHIAFQGVRIPSHGIEHTRTILVHERPVTSPLNFVYPLDSIPVEGNLSMVIDGILLPSRRNQAIAGFLQNRRLRRPLLRRSRWQLYYRARHKTHCNKGSHKLRPSQTETSHPSLLFL